MFMYSLEQMEMFMEAFQRKLAPTILILKNENLRAELGATAMSMLVTVHAPSHATSCL